MNYAPVTDREALLRTASILDLLAAGWRPGKAELDEARYLERWLILPGPAGRPYQIIGEIWSLPARRTAIVASVIAIDPETRWVRIWDEWVVIDDGLAGAATFDSAEVQRIAAAWVLRELQASPVH